MELAGNSKSLEEGQLRIIKSKVSVFVSSLMEEVDVDGHIVQIVDFVDVDEDHEKLAWVDKCPLCDAKDHIDVWSRCDQGVRDLAEAEKIKFNNIAASGLQAA